MHNKILDIIFSILFLLIGSALLAFDLILNNDTFIPFIIVSASAIFYGLLKLIAILFELRR